MRGPVPMTRIIVFGGLYCGAPSGKLLCAYGPRALRFFFEDCRLGIETKRAGGSEVFHKIWQQPDMSYSLNS